METLYLTLKKDPYDVMQAGDKPYEFRRPSDWLMSRLTDKHGYPRGYDKVRFTLGYQKGAPYFERKFIAWGIYRGERRMIPYPNGLLVDVQPGDVIIWFEHRKTFNS
jgi:hypothetical protein